MHHRLGLAGGDHHVAGLQALDHLDLARHADAGGDDRFVGLAVDHGVDEAGLAFLHQGLFRHQQAAFDRVAGVQHQLGELARAQLAVGVGDLGPQLHAAAVGVDHRCDRHHLSTELLARERVHGDVDRLAGGKLRQRALGHAEVDLDRIHPDQRNQVLANADEVADADLAQADAAGERCPQCHLRQRRTGRGDARLVDRERGTGLVVVGACDQLRVGQFGGAGVGAAAVVEVGLGFVEGRPGDAGVEREQRLPGADPAAFLEMDAFDPPTDLGPDHDRLVGAQAADRLQAAAQGLRLDGDSLDRQLHLAAGRTSRRRGVGVVTTAGQGQHSGEHDSSNQQGAAHGGSLVHFLYRSV